jgi:hypothetical protein
MPFTKVYNHNTNYHGPIGHFIFKSVPFGNVLRSLLIGSFGFVSIFRRCFFLRDLRRRSRPPTLIKLIISPPHQILIVITCHTMHISLSLHSLDCNLADEEYVLIPEQGAVHEEDQEQAPETAIEDLPAAPAIEGKPLFYA